MDQGGRRGMGGQPGARRGARGAIPIVPGMTANTPPMQSLPGQPLLGPPPQAQGWQNQPWQGQAWPGVNPWAGGWGNPADAVPEENLQGGKNSIVYRSNNLPQELDWFQQLDTDHDGQVGLYEWRAGGRPISEFDKRDLNGDGFLTPEEVLKYEAKLNPSLRTDSQASLAQANTGPRTNIVRGNASPQSLPQGQGGGRSNNGQAANFQGNNRPQNGQPSGGGGRGGRGGNRRGGQGAGSPDGP
jgi:hypothetical protein